MATEFEKVQKYRKMAEDKTIPQDIRNDYLDKANAIEFKAYEDMKAGKEPPAPPPKKMAMGGMVVNQGVGASMKPHNMFNTKGKK